MVTLRTPLCEVLGIDYPIIQAPMAGATTVDMAAAVCEAGALGGFGHAYTEPEAMREDARALRARSARGFGINLSASPAPGEPPLPEQRAAIEAMRGHFEHLGLPLPERVAPPYAPDRSGQIAAVCAIAPRVFTGHLGDITPDAIGQLRAARVRIGASATSVREA